MCKPNNFVSSCWWVWGRQGPTRSRVHPSLASWRPMEQISTSKTRRGNHPSTSAQIRTCAKRWPSVTRKGTGNHPMILYMSNNSRNSFIFVLKICNFLIWKCDICYKNAFEINLYICDISTKTWYNVEILCGISDIGIATILTTR